MAHFANSLSDERNLGIRFQVLVPLQMVGNTRFLQHVAGAYARREGLLNNWRCVVLDGDWLDRLARKRLTYTEVL
jgi:hypothetical protein